MAKSKDQISVELADIESKTSEILEILKANPNPDQRINKLIGDIKEIMDFVRNFNN